MKEVLVTVTRNRGHASESRGLSSQADCRGSGTGETDPAHPRSALSRTGDRGGTEAQCSKVRQIKKQFYVEQSPAHQQTNWVLVLYDPFYEWSFSTGTVLSTGIHNNSVTVCRNLVNPITACAVRSFVHFHNHIHPRSQRNKWFKVFLGTLWRHAQNLGTYITFTNYFMLSHQHTHSHLYCLWKCVRGLWRLREDEWSQHFTVQAPITDRGTAKRRVSQPGWVCHFQTLLDNKFLCVERSCASVTEQTTSKTCSSRPEQNPPTVLTFVKFVETVFYFHIEPSHGRQTSHGPHPHTSSWPTQQLKKGEKQPKAPKIQGKDSWKVPLAVRERGRRRRRRMFRSDLKQLFLCGALKMDPCSFPLHPATLLMLPILCFQRDKHLLLPPREKENQFHLAISQSRWNRTQPCKYGFYFCKDVDENKASVECFSF